LYDGFATAYLVGVGCLLIRYLEDTSVKNYVFAVAIFVLVSLWNNVSLAKNLPVAILMAFMVFSPDHRFNPVTYLASVVKPGIDVFDTDEVEKKKEREVQDQ